MTSVAAEFNALENRIFMMIQDRSKRLSKGKITKFFENNAALGIGTYVDHRSESLKVGLDFFY